MSYILNCRNVCDMLPAGVHYLSHVGQREDSRAGPVIVAPFPVLSVYQRPAERVLLSPRRDANPFFHLFESLWMLAGRDDVASLQHYVKNFDNFAEPGGEIHGAYGRRWRSALEYDQIDVIIGKLRANPQDRQAVLQMWDGSQSLEDAHQTYAGSDDLRGRWKDRPCNTHVYFRVRKEFDLENDADYRKRILKKRQDDSAHLEIGEMLDRLGETVHTRRIEDKFVLDLTVLCRSNDIIWGAYGANAVHFSMLMEYVAGRLGVGMGRMYQFSNNWHGYVEELDKLGDPKGLFDEGNPYSDNRNYTTLPIGDDWEHWDEDLNKFVEFHDMLWDLGAGVVQARGMFHNAWFYDVAWRASVANWLRRNGRPVEALATAQRIAAGDWRIACVEWLQRRATK